MRVRWSLGSAVVVALAAACASTSSGVGGESHFSCRTQSDCESHPGDVCFFADPSSDRGECVSQSAILDAASHIGTGGSGGRGGTAGTSGQSGFDAGAGNASPSTPYCGAPGPATYPDPPTNVPPSTKDVEVVAAEYTIDLGDRPKSAVEPTHFLEIGFDLDNKCTTVDTLKTATTCKPPPYALGVVDGNGGIDNAFGIFIQTIRDVVKDFSSEQYTQDIQSGKANVLIRLQNWNGQANDDEVRVSTIVAAPFDSFSPDARPLWDGRDAWPVAADSLNSASIDDPKFVDTHAYVNNFQLVASLSEGNLRLDVGLSSVRRVRLDLKLSAAFVVCDIAPEATGKWGYTFSKCTLGGRWLADDLVKQLGQFPNPLANNAALCRGNPTYESFKEALCSRVDMLHTLGSPTQDCDALSVGMTFTMKPGQLGNIFDPTPIADPCCVPPGCIPGSFDDYTHNPKYDCCASIGGPDGGLGPCGVTVPPPPPGTGGAASTGGSGPTDSGPG